MRRVGLMVPQAATRDGERVELFAPLPDLSGVDTSAVADHARAATAAGIPVHLAGEHGRGPHLSSLEPAGPFGSPLGVQRFLGERRPLDLLARRGIEHGRAPVGLRAADELGNASAMTTTAVLIIDEPRPAAELVLDRAGGRLVATITEWPDG